MFYFVIREFDKVAENVCKKSLDFFISTIFFVSVILLRCQELPPQVLGTPLTGMTLVAEIIP